MYKLMQGDCLELMKTIEAGSVDLVLCDPPYGTMNGSGKTFKDTFGDKYNWDNILPFGPMFTHLDRVLRQNGRAVLFSQEPFTFGLMSHAIPNLPFSYRMVWEKNNFANALGAKSAPVNYFEDILMFQKRHDYEALHPLRPYFKQVLDFVGLNLKEINKRLGHRRAEHCFYVTPKKALLTELGGGIDHTLRVGSSQFALCIEPTYKELIDKFGIDKMRGFKRYAQLKAIDIRFKQKQAPTFNLPPNKKHKSNIFKYSKPTKSVHPTQKPVPLLCDLIETFSRPNDLILDFTMGSGSTGVAVIKTGRRFIGIEQNPKYFKIAQTRLKAVQTKLF